MSAKARNGNPHVCCVCARELDPAIDAVVYLGWGAREDGRAGRGWVAALCAPTPAEVTGHASGRCVEAAREWGIRTRTVLHPSTYAEWLGR